MMAAAGEAPLAADAIAALDRLRLVRRAGRTPGQDAGRRAEHLARDLRDPDTPPTSSSRCSGRRTRRPRRRPAPAPRSPGVNMTGRSSAPPSKRGCSMRKKPPSISADTTCSGSSRRRSISSPASCQHWRQIAGALDDSRCRRSSSASCHAATRCQHAAYIAAMRAPVAASVARSGGRTLRQIGSPVIAASTAFSSRNAVDRRDMPARWRPARRDPRTGGAAARAPGSPCRRSCPCPPAASARPISISAPTSAATSGAAARNARN